MYGKIVYCHDSRQVVKMFTEKSDLIDGTDFMFEWNGNTLDDIVDKICQIASDIGAHRSVIIDDFTFEEDEDESSDSDQIQSPEIDSARKDVVQNLINEEIGKIMKDNLCS